MVGVAQKVCKSKRNIWSPEDCMNLTKAIQSLMQIEKSLFDYINPRITGKFMEEKERLEQEKKLTLFSSKSA